MSSEATNGPLQLAGGVRLSKGRQIVGISRPTAGLLRNEGMLKVVVRYGRPYVTAEAAGKFFNPAEAQSKMLSLNKTHGRKRERGVAPPGLQSGGAKIG